MIGTPEFLEAGPLSGHDAGKQKFMYYTRNERTQS